MNRVTQFSIGLIAIVLALGAGLYGRNLYTHEVSTYQVPVPLHPIPAYTLLSADQFELRDMPRALESLPYYQSLTSLEGLISTNTLPGGLPVPVLSALPVSEFRLADASFEVLSIPVEPVSAVGGQIRIGERVNLYQVSPEQVDVEVEDGDDRKFMVERIVGSIQVVDVRNAQGVTASSDPSEEDLTTFDGRPQNEQVQILTLAVEPGQVNIILTAVANAKKQGGLLWTTLATP
jgi:Flp pilus assembly protein CpaB